MKDLNTLQCIEKEKCVLQYDSLYFHYNEYKIILYFRFCCYVRCIYIVIDIYKRNVFNNCIELPLNIDDNELDYIYRKLSYELKCKDKEYELNLIKRYAYILNGI